MADNKTNLEPKPENELDAPQDTPVVQDASNLATKPGTILKAARDEMGLSLQQVADELHLRVSIVEQLEREIYEEFNSEVFLKGYFRSYCRLVGLHEERMAELLDAQLKLRKDTLESEVDAEQKRQNRQSRSKFLKLTAVFGALLAGSIFLLSMFVPLNSLEQNEPQGANKPLDGDVESAPSEVKKTLIEEAKAIQQTMLEQTVFDGRTIKRESAVESETVVESSGANKLSNVSPELKPKPERQLKPDLSGSEEQSAEQTEKSAEQAEKSLDVVVGLIALEFSGDCWFQLLDGRGKTVFSSLKSVGDTVNYLGQLPYRIVLGNARVTTIRFNDEILDLSSKTSKNGRAEFTLQ